MVAPSPTFKTLLPQEQIVQSPFLARSASSNQQGIDLSYSNTVDSFHQVAGAGITFTFLKASEGVSIQDTNFAGYRQRAESVGLTVGMYHILSPGVDASTQLRNYLFVIGTVKAGEQACLIDIEPDDGWFQLDPSIRLARILHFANDCHQATGATPAIYISPDIAGSYIVDTTGLNAYQLWLTEWTSDSTPVLMSPWTTWRYWQYSDSGTVPGVEDSVDLDLSNGTLSVSAQGP